MMDEVGTKTGKAIGNTVFGKKAADQTINVNTGCDGGSGNTGRGSLLGLATAMVESSKQSDELQLKQYEDKEAIKRELRDIEFDSDDIKNNYTRLLKLITIIDAEKPCCYLDNDGDIVDEEGLYTLAVAKYSSWLAMLQIQDSTNPNLVYFLTKQKEWDDYWQAKRMKEKEDSKRTKKIVMAIVCFFVVLLLFAIMNM